VHFQRVMPGHSILGNSALICDISTMLVFLVIIVIFGCASASFGIAFDCIFGIVWELWLMFDFIEVVDRRAF
jgi:hypothetical protein